MSFMIDYQPLFFVGIEEQNSGKVLPDMSFQPTATCRQLLADRHMVFKSRENGGQIFYQRNLLAQDPILGRISKRINFCFTLSLKRRNFLDLYKPDLSGETGQHLYFDNLTGSGNIQTDGSLTTGGAAQSSDAIRIQPSVFIERVDVSGDSPPTVLRIKRKLGSPSPVPDVPIESSATTRQVLTKIDLTSFPSGVYTVTTNQSEAKTRRFYIDDEIAKQRVVGIVDIFWEDSQETAPAEGVPYVLRFEKR